MRILLIADIHGNLPALEAVLAEAGHVDRVICAGDLAGYFPYVNEVIERMASLENLICVRGNHDHVLIREGLTTGSFSADRALAIQREIVNESSRKFLEGLPEKAEEFIEGKRFLVFHGSPENPLNGRDDFWETEVMEQVIYLRGHSHKPFLLQNDAEGWTIINPGSCGLPRDGDPRASFAILDTARWQTLFHRVDYSRSSLAEKCRQSGLPDNFLKSLEAGMWVAPGRE